MANYPSQRSDEADYDFARSLCNAWQILHARNAVKYNIHDKTTQGPIHVLSSLSACRERLGTTLITLRCNCSSLPQGLISGIALPVHGLSTLPSPRRCPDGTLAPT